MQVSVTVANYFIDNSVNCVLLAWLDVQVLGAQTVFMVLSMDMWGLFGSENKS